MATACDDITQTIEGIAVSNKTVHSSKRIPDLTAFTLLLGFVGLLTLIGSESHSSGSFSIASVRVEQNVTDGDMEVVFEVKGGDEGLVKLGVRSPDGRTVIDFKAPDASTLGIRQFSFESPEPRNIDSIKAAYPEGVYTFEGITAAGDKLHGKSALNHKLPGTVSFLLPAAGARNVRTQILEITWTPVKKADAYLIEIEQDELDIQISAKLPGTVTGFAMPAGFLLPDTEYQLSIGTETVEGNISFVETTFTTAGKH